MTAILPDHRHDTISGEQRLWTAVIIRALTDALWRDDNPDGDLSAKVWFFGDGIRRRRANTIRDESIFWLTTPNRHFIDVCLMAGLEPDLVRVKAKELLDAAETDEEAKAITDRLSVRGL